MIELLSAARRVSVPIIVIRTADQFATANVVAKVAVEVQPNVPVLTWDAANGIQPMGNQNADPKSAERALWNNGAAALKSLQTPPEETIAFAGAMIAAQRLPSSSVLIAMNGHRQLTSADPMATAASVQAVANLRDAFKVDFRMLVILAPVFTAPPELEQDVVVLDHALPGEDDLATLIRELCESADLPAPTADTVAASVEALSGLSLFSAEQQAAMSFNETGINISALWERKRVTIEQTRGLRVWRGAEKFADLVGLDSVKARLRTRIGAKTPVGVVVVLDEIDKVFANVEHETSGTKMDQMTNFLTEMENNEWRGLTAVGVAGGGKSALAKAFGNEAGVPTIMLDFGGMLGPHVGESEEMVRHAIAVIKAVGRGHAYFVATSNNMSVMRPEMQRRFTDGMFFFDLMSDAERDAAWRFYMKKYDIKAQARPVDEGWTGAEIRNCCRDAWDTGLTLVEAAKFIVPMATSRMEVIDQLRQDAHGKFLDANNPGTYEYTTAPVKKQLRAIRLPQSVVSEIQSMKES